MSAEPRNTNEAHVLEYLSVCSAMRDRSIEDPLFPPLPDKFKYRGVEHFLMKHGAFYDIAPLPHGIAPMMMKQCFDNAYKLARQRRNLHYVEGIAFGVIPVYHAWCVDKNGTIVDPTWAQREGGLGTAYFGVELVLAEVLKSRRKGQYSLLHDYTRDFPALRGEAVLHSSPYRRP